MKKGWALNPTPKSQLAHLMQQLWLSLVRPTAQHSLFGLARIRNPLTKMVTSIKVTWAVSKVHIGFLKLLRPGPFVPQGRKSKVRDNKTSRLRPKLNVKVQKQTMLHDTLIPINLLGVDQIRFNMIVNTHAVSMVSTWRRSWYTGWWQLPNVQWRPSAWENRYMYWSVWKDDVTRQEHFLDYNRRAQLVNHHRTHRHDVKDQDGRSVE